MPFEVAENDDLPHKICFRCSAKVEELYEFIQKCINAQHNLHKSRGRKEVMVTKPKTRTIWEQKLNKSNMSNDDICDALIKKAMEGIRDIPFSPLPPKDGKPTLNIETKPSTPSLPLATNKDTRYTVRQTRNSNESDQSLEDDEKLINTYNKSQFIPTRVSRSKNATDCLLDGLQDFKRKKPPSKPNDNKGNKAQEECLIEKPGEKNMLINYLSFDATDNLLDGLQDVNKNNPPSKPNYNKGNEAQEESLAEKPAEKNMCINKLSFEYDDETIDYDDEPIDYDDEPIDSDDEPIDYDDEPIGYDDEPIDYDDEPIIITKPIKSTSDRSKESTPKDVEPVDKKPFDIMDHVCMIKVNGVGIIFQCKLCNRNFLKKELILSHGCAKTGVSKADFTKKLIPPAPPKASVVKYITTKVDSEPIKPPLENINPPLENKSDLIAEEETKNTTVDKPKPKIGPASRVKRKENDYNSITGITVVPMAIESATTSKSDPKPSTPIIENNSNPAPSAIPSVKFPTIPSLNSRYKLPGQNDTFQLIEESSNNPEPEVEVTVENNTKTGKKRKSDPPKAAEAKSHKQNSDKGNNNVEAPVYEVIDLDEEQPAVQILNIQSLNPRYRLVPGLNNTFHLVEESPNNPEPEVEETVENKTKTGKKRKSDPSKSAEAKSRKQNSDNSKNMVKAPVCEVIDLEDEQQPATIPNTNSQSYPDGSFQTLPHHSAVYTPQVATVPTFTTPGMKKQSYTVVQTGNPSKLLISTKPQPVAEEVPKKRSRKTKAENRKDTVAKQPLSVTLEETAPPKNSGFFTFINVDPLLMPSYVLPTNNIIQESQISTSTSAAKTAIENKEEKYSCNMCGESFSREKKLLAHIQSHYNKMDEEDNLRHTK